MGAPTGVARVGGRGGGPPPGCGHSCSSTEFPNNNFEANWSRGSRVIIGHTKNRQTKNTTLCIY